MDKLGFGGDNVDDVDWDAADRVHDWRNHVGQYVKAIWGTFTHAQRLAIALDAETDACAEEWD